MMRTGKPPVYYVWIGSRGVVAHAHLDSVYNFYVQIYGRKRFVLFPPRLFETLKLYPKLHPRNGQSQINFTAPQADLFPEFLTSASQDLLQKHVRVADLEPGDVLILPPYWLHYVTALEASISVSLWAYAEAVNVTAAITAVPVPFHRDWNDAQRRAALGYFMMSLFEQLGPIPHASTTRMSPVGDSGSTSTLASDDQSNLDAARARLRMLVHDRYRSFHALPAFNHAPYNTTECLVGTVLDQLALRRASAAVAAQLNTLQPYVRDIFALDYIEELLNAAVQPAHVFATLLGYSSSCMNGVSSASA